MVRCFLIEAQVLIIYSLPINMKEKNLKRYSFCKKLPIENALIILSRNLMVSLPHANETL